MGRDGLRRVLHLGAILSNTLSEKYTQILLAELRDGKDMTSALLNVTKQHADHLRELGPVRVLALDPCPRCMGRVIATETEARCVTCDWRYCEVAA